MPQRKTRTPGIYTVTVEDVEALAGDGVFQRGLAYARGGNVLHVHPSADGLTAEVAGSGAQPYEVEVHSDDGGIQDYWCDCPYAEGGFDACKHLVAALIRWIEIRDGKTAAPGARIQPYSPIPARPRGGHGGRPALPPPPDAWAGYWGGSGRRPSGAGDLLSVWQAGGNGTGTTRAVIDLYGDGPALEASLTWTDSGRRGSFFFPAPEVPFVLDSLRALRNVEWSPRAAALRISDEIIEPRLDGDLDAGGRVRLLPHYALPGKKGRPAILTTEEFKKGALGGGWYFDGTTFFPVAHLSEDIAPYFDGHRPLTIEGDAAVDFITEEFKVLAASLQFKASRSLSGAKVVNVVLSEIQVQTEGDWEALDAVYKSRDLTVNLREILHMQERSRFLRKGNTFVERPEDEVVQAARQAKMDAKGRFIMSRHDLLRTRSAWDRSVSVKGDPVFKEWMARLDRLASADPAPPIRGMEGTLRNYQQAGYDWLWAMRQGGFHGILADDMGLGKTHQAMALLLAARTEGVTRPSLVICPTTVLDHWERKVREHAPGLKPLRYHGPARARYRNVLAAAPLVLTTYPLLPRDFEHLASVEWEYVILDEAQKIKNAHTQAWHAARRLNSRHRLALTGTPIENRLGELWSIFDFLMPGYLGTLEEFRDRFVTAIVKENKPEAREALKRLIHPFKLRRLKGDVLKDLPPKQEDKRYCLLSPHQAALYRAILDRDEPKLRSGLNDKGKPIGYIDILAMLVKLKQVCDHPALVVDAEHAHKLPSGKFELFKEILDEALDSGQKVVVFSQFLGMLDLIEAHLRERKVGHTGLRGSTVKRAEVIQKFQTDPECRVFCGSLLAGGLGVDLTAGSVVIHYDRWWNAAREDQATDRVHRIGQTRGVNVFKLIAKGTLEEKIDRMILNKGRLMESVVESDPIGIKNLTREELLELLTFDEEEAVGNGGNGRGAGRE